MKRIMIIGASGVFGSRLATLLNHEPNIMLVLAARSKPKLQQLLDRLDARHSFAIIDRDQISSEDLQNIDLVIDAAGPFHKGHDMVIQASISAGCDYIDLADGREFIANIGQYDDAAQEAGVAVISGASSIPALSHAVIDKLCHSWRAIDDIYVGIFPGNRAPRGLSVVQSILSYAGRPVRVFKNGHWQHLTGWAGLHRRNIPFAGKRWASICDTPEQDLLVEAYSPAGSAEFYAGMELSILHLGLYILSLPVRWGLLNTLQPASKALLWMSRQFLLFGSDIGAMDVEIKGHNASGQSRTSRWVLRADANHGPNVPIFAAAILARRLAKGIVLPKGARPCHGLIKLEEFEADFAQFGIKTVMQENAAPQRSALLERIVLRFPIASRFLSV